MNLESKSVHPFFSKPSSAHVPASVDTADDTANDTANDDAHENTENTETNTKAGPGRKKRARKTDGAKDKNVASHMKNQASLDRFTRPPPTQGVLGNAMENADTDAPAEASLEVDPNHNRRKRQKTVSPEPPTSAQPQPDSLDWHQQLQLQAGEFTNMQATIAQPIHADSVMVDISRVQTNGPEEQLGPPIVASTPPSIAPAELDTAPSEPILGDSKKAMPRKQIKISKSGKLLSSPPKPALEPTTSPKKRRGRKPTKAKIFPTVTVIRYGTDTASRAAIGQKIEDILNATKTSKTRTVTQNRAPPKPAVPPKNTHPFFRGKTQKDEPPAKVVADLHPPNIKKSACTPGKLRAEALRDREPEPVHAFNSGLRTNKDVKQSGLNEAVWPTGDNVHVRNLNTTYLLPHLGDSPCVNLVLRPRKLKNAVVTVPGHEDLVARLAYDLIQDRTSARAQSTSQPGLSECARLPTRLLTTGVEIQRRVREQLLAQVPTSRTRAIHTAIGDLFDEIEHTLTPFDEGRCEVLSWPQKYAPRTASHVLQIGTEAMVLKDWLQSLTVLASAMVHAVANELGFEVFEINAGMRRSGKDIQDKVGDMTANHLVNHKRSAVSIQEPLTDNDTDNDMDMALEKDISSGRQGTMTSFFQAKPGTTTAKPKPKPKVQVTDVKKKTAPAAQSTLPLTQASRNSQKQSLILIEEADILFDEDQQFWAQIIKIASLSKRPIVITCNDERQIPMHDLPLAAILRLQPAPTDVATDYLLVLAGREGHILERQAVRDLYESKDHDLRASITELNLWCQMSVGDRKGGLEWMYQRWPAGKDMDEQGRKLRVASEGTYKSGMGWLSHDMFQSQSNAAFDKEEELLQEIWADWGISPSAWTASMRQGQSLPQTHTAKPLSRIEELKRLDAFADSLSAADVFCRVDLPNYETDDDLPIDATQPPIPEKSRMSYTLAAPLLQADPSADYLNLDTAFSIQTHLLIHRIYPDFSASSSTTPLLLTEDLSAPSVLRARHTLRTSTPLTRPIFASALDCLAAPPDQLLAERTSFTLTPSSFDRTFSIITLDLAPYVRSIVAHEQVLESQRLHLGSLLAAGGTGKRARTTRASRVALEGGVRETKRRDRWFDADVDFDAVMRTAGGWAGMGWKGEDGHGDDEVETPNAGDVEMGASSSSSQE
ncbi:ATPase family AAA domain-containing 5 [Pyrenophora seminiperda CCB06]|uniref:ATPase family AAA domain-containing 5 n=1 Tax=Pyrenophora seminiperda CCB06 TaxID=1302712 RepID=A0A3M7M9C6_9PLEO|nr:ATPase family AAA domain-containing 5 [Pyrenophora seminiperda CCB06]